MKMVAFLKNRIIGVLLVIELVLCSIVALSMSRTSDEHCHWLYGKKVLLGNPDRDSSEFDSKMPVTALLTGVLGGDDVRWLREGCRPVGHVAYAHVLCEVASAVSMGVGSGRQKAHP